jgi:hypothetical protein
VALINQYLEEAIQRCHELAEMAGDVAAEAEDIRVDAEAMEDVAESEADTLHDAYEEAIAALNEARERIVSELDAALAALKHVEDEGGEAAAAAEKILAAVRDGAALLRQLRGRLGETIDLETDAAEAAMDAVGQAGRTHAARLESGLEAATEHGGAVGTACGRASDAIQQGAEEFTRRLAALSATAMGSTMEFATAVDTMLMALGEKALDFGNASIAGHNDAVYALRHGFTGEEPSQAPLLPEDAWPSVALSAMGDAAAELAGIRDAAQETLAAATEGLAQQAGAATQKLLGVAAAVSDLFPLPRA